MGGPWIHTILNAAPLAPHGPLWYSSTDTAHNFDRDGLVFYSSILQTAGWYNESYFSSAESFRHVSVTHGGTLLDSGGNLWFLGQVGPDGVGNGWVGRWNPLTHQIEQGFQV